MSPLTTVTPHADFQISSTPIYPRDAILNASPANEHFFFLRGPFEDLEDDKFVFPYKEGVDYEAPTTYHTVNSCGGRIRHGTGPDELLSLDIYALAELGGWDGESAYQEVYTGGADVLPDYVCGAIATALLDYLGKHDDEPVVDGRRIRRELIWRAYVIFRAGPTTIPW